ncbi:unnamed protein product [Prorocentrum cordatum]|uniref:Subtilisin n=1 Tax=Prorocentrum cordatum TaxID=2364126 RepID=A0ABN9WP95_9DINO|nr:unnamed protein product [Polarella glacialis]
MDMGKLCLLLFLLPVSDARLRGFKAQDLPAAEAPSLEVPATVSCGQESPAVPDTPLGEFDELALLQREMTPTQGVHQKSHEEWLAHASEGQTKISADERVLHNDTVVGQLSKLSSDGCADDPMWQDADGDGCEIYGFAIASGKMTQEAVCNGGGDVPPARGLRGSAMRVVADATAKDLLPRHVRHVLRHRAHGGRREIPVLVCTLVPSSICALDPLISESPRAPPSLNNYGYKVRHGTRNQARNRQSVARGQCIVLHNALTPLWGQDART